MRRGHLVLCLPLLVGAACARREAPSGGTTSAAATSTAAGATTASATAPSGPTAPAPRDAAAPTGSGEAASPAASAATPGEAASATPPTGAPAADARGCGAGEVYVPPTGPQGFAMGRGKPGEDDQRHTVVLTRGFCLDATEVTVRAYRACVEKGDCTVPQLRDQNSNYRPEYARDDHPINMVNFAQVTRFCEAQGKRLPTEAEWEWAAGAGQRRYPWGDADPSCESGHADFTPEGTPHLDPAGNYGCHGGGTSPVATHRAGDAVWPGGALHDLGGNVWEWTADCYLPYPTGTVTDPSPQANPHLKGDCYVRALRGGGWNRSKVALEVTLRAGSKRTYRVPGLGFRCARTIEPGAVAAAPELPAR